MDRQVDEAKAAFPDVRIWREGDFISLERGGASFTFMPAERSGAAHIAARGVRLVARARRLWRRGEVLVFGVNG